MPPMNLRSTIMLGLVVLLILTQLPTMFCILSNTPDGDIENVSNSETMSGVNSLIGCITPTSIFGVILFVGGEALVILLDG